MVFFRCLLLTAVLCADTAAFAQAPIAYQLSFADRAHRLMDVDVTFSELPAEPLQVRISRASPGRYALHDFAKNVFDVRITDGNGRPLPTRRPNPHAWDVTEHGDVVRVRYRVFGDRVDGTYLSVDSTHAHINMPAAMMWARGLELRPIVVRFELPAGAGWKVATQLFAGPDPQTFTAPTLQYLMDSPTELSAFASRSFSVGDGAQTPTFRIAAHHTGTDAELDSLTADVERVVREARNVFREFPSFENSTYTFIADWQPSANSDAMEHRNSTALSSPTSIRTNRLGLLDSISHEFFHTWNVERIRPRSLEPFNFEDQNISGELWLAEGFTNYYGPLVLLRSGLTGIGQFTTELGDALNTVVTSPGRQLRNTVEMSEQAAFVDAAASIDRTVLDNTFISYYTWGSAIAMGLDLTLREQTNHRVTLDDLMRALWQKYGKPGGRLPGYVDNPYSNDDVRSTLGAITGNQPFADEFFRRYIEGREVVDYEALCARAGLLWRRIRPGGPFIGLLRLQQDGDGARLVAAVPFGSPAYAAGLDRDDVIVAMGDTPIHDPAGFQRTLSSYKPGQRVPLTFVRNGQRMMTTVTVEEDPRRELVPLERTGAALTQAQRQFRDAWLGSAGRGL